MIIFKEEFIIFNGFSYIELIELRSSSCTTFC